MDINITKLNFFNVEEPFKRIHTMHAAFITKIPEIGDTMKWIKAKSNDVITKQGIVVNRWHGKTHKDIYIKFI